MRRGNLEARNQKREARNKIGTELGIGNNVSNIDWFVKVRPIFFVNRKTGIMTVWENRERPIVLCGEADLQG